MTEQVIECPPITYRDAKICILAIDTIMAQIPERIPAKNIEVVEHMKTAKRNLQAMLAFADGVIESEKQK